MIARERSPAQNVVKLSGSVVRGGSATFCLYRHTNLAGVPSHKFRTSESKLTSTYHYGRRVTDQALALQH